MLAIPAIDLMQGDCVQLVGGDPANERVRLRDPRAVVRRWTSLGFQRLHVVDLDAALSNGDNRTLIEEMIQGTEVPVQAGGGIRDDAILARLLGAGAESVVVGTRAIEDPAWLAAACARAPGRLILAADVRGEEVVAGGWTTGTRRPVRDVVARFSDLPLAALLVTAVHREGRMQGPDLALIETVVAASPWPVIASGGIATRQDLVRLADRGAAGAVLGMALYTGALDARETAEEFDRWP